MADQQKPPPGASKPAGGAPTAAGNAPSGPQPAKINQPGLKPLQQPSTRVTLSKGKAKVGVNYKQAQQAEIEKKKQEEEKLAAMPIEDRVFNLLKVKELPQPELFKQFMEKVTFKLELADTSLAILEAFSNIDVTAERVCGVIRANPYYESVFTRVVETVGKREEMPSLEGAVVLLGMQNFRNLIIGVQAVRTVLGTHAEWDKDGKLKVSPNEVVKYALRAEDLLLTKKSAYSDMGFAAGLVFDLLNLVADSVSQDKKKTAAYLDVVFNHGLRTAQIGMELVNLIPDFGFKKYIFPACLLHDVGKACAAMLQPDYLNFLEEARKKEWPRTVQDYVEQAKFGVHHAVLGEMVCHAFQMFRPIEKVVAFHHQPFMLHTRNRTQYQLAAIVCMATNIANHFKKTERVDDPIVSLWKGPELRDFKIDMKSVVKSVAESIQI